MLNVYGKKESRPILWYNKTTVCFLLGARDWKESRSSQQQHRKNLSYDVITFLLMTSFVHWDLKNKTSSYSTGHACFHFMTHVLQRPYVFLYRSGRPHRPLRPHRHPHSPRAWATIKSRNRASVEKPASQPNHIFQLNGSQAGVSGLGQSSTLGRMVPRRSAHLAESTRDQDGDA